MPFYFWSQLVKSQQSYRETVLKRVTNCYFLRLDVWYSTSRNIRMSKKWISIIIRKFKIFLVFSEVKFLATARNYFLPTSINIWQRTNFRFVSKCCFLFYWRRVSHIACIYRCLVVSSYIYWTETLIASVDQKRDVFQQLWAVDGSGERWVAGATFYEPHTSPANDRGAADTLCSGFRKLTSKILRNPPDITHHIPQHIV